MSLDPLLFFLLLPEQVQKLIIHLSPGQTFISFHLSLSMKHVVKLLLIIILALPLLSSPRERCQVKFIPELFPECSVIYEGNGDTQALISETNIGAHYNAN